MSDAEFRCLQSGQRARFFVLEGSKELTVLTILNHLCCDKIPGGIYVCSERCARAFGLLGGKTQTLAAKESPSWKKRGPTREEQKKALIKDRCARIEKLLASVAKMGTPVSPYLQDVGAIKRKATQELSGIRLVELDDELVTLFSKLKSVRAADGEAIISPRRYELFFSSRGS